MKHAIVKLKYRRFSWIFSNSEKYSFFEWIWSKRFPVWYRMKIKYYYMLSWCDREEFICYKDISSIYRVERGNMVFCTACRGGTVGRIKVKVGVTYSGWRKICIHPLFSSHHAVYMWREVILSCFSNAHSIIEVGVLTNKICVTGVEQTPEEFTRDICIRTALLYGASYHD